MVTVQQVNTESKSEVKRFIKIHFDLYRNCPQWVPPLLIDCEVQLNKKKHPFYEHSDADFFIAEKDGKDAGRIAILENRHFNQYHKTKNAQFYLFDSVDDQEVAEALFAKAFEWSRERNLDTVVGPKGFSSFDGYGIQVEGFENRQVMNMMNYNYSYYPKLVEHLGFEKEVDFISCYLGSSFHLPERVHRIAERIQARGTLKVIQFNTKKELKQYAQRIGKLYNDTFINNWEYYPLTEREIKYVLDTILLIADPKLIKLILDGEKVVGFLFGFPDLSAAMQRAKGRLLPFGIFDIMTEGARTEWISLNGAGVLPEYQGKGGNALLYVEMENTLRNYHFKHADLTQVAETARNMRSDLINVGGKPYKNHRVYKKFIG